MATSISGLVTAGELAPGTRPPTVRALARRSAWRCTVNQAWQSLGRAGVVETRGRNGTHVRPNRGAAVRSRRMNASPRLRLDLSLGTPDPELLPELGAGRLVLPQGYLVSCRTWRRPVPPRPFPPG